jgi:hypothetical protein
MYCELNSAGILFIFIKYFFIKYCLTPNNFFYFNGGICELISVKKTNYICELISYCTHKSSKINLSFKSLLRLPHNNIDFF